MAVHDASATKIQQNKLRIDCATSSNFVNNLIDLNQWFLNFFVCFTLLTKMIIRFTPTI